MVLTVKHNRIWVTFDREGVHLYPAALTDPSLCTGDAYDVEFLGYLHRHKFFFRVEIDVYHNDRDIEFIQFKRWCEQLFDAGTLQLNNKSCEMIADDLAAAIRNKYPHRNIVISVAEDNENGAIKHYEPER